MYSTSPRRAGGIAATRRKALLLTAYLERLLRSRGLLAAGGVLQLLSPTDPVSVVTLP